MTTETVVVNTPITDDANNDAANNAALQAAADAGVTVNGEQVEAPAAAPAAKTERPENVPEKFWDADKGEVRLDAVLASNKELQANFTKDKQGETPADETPTGETPEGDTPAQTSAIQAAATSFETNGELAEADYTALEASGISKEMADQYISGIKAQGDLVMQHAYGLTGGEADFNAMTEWAGENLSPEELTAFNVQVVNEETSDFAIANLFAKFSAERPMETPLINGNNNAANAGEHFKSTAEMQEAMNDKKYKTDPAFRQSVANRISAADKAGVNLFG